MSRIHRILLLGASPLPGEGDARLMAPGLRTWQLASALAAAGHTVRAVCLRDPHAAPDAAAPPAAEDLDLEVVHLQRTRFATGPALEEHHAAFRPDAIVGASSFLPSQRAAELRSDRPRWLDLPGDLLAEAQLRCAAAPETERAALLTRYWDALRPCLDRGDRFSTVSERQRAALYGQLALRGRLGPATVGEALVHTIEPVPYPPATGADPPPALKHLPDDAQVICTSGGWNTWVDAPTLAAALKSALVTDPALYFFAAGGVIEGHDEGTLPTFRAALTHDRARVLGRLSTPHLEGLYARADVAVLADRPCLETTLGSRNRVLDWLRAGVDVVATRGSELVDTLERAGALLAVEPANPAALASAIRRALADRPAGLERRRRAREIIASRFTTEATSAPLLAWAANPTHAGDHGRASPLEDARADHLEVELEELRGALQRVYNSPTFRTLGSLHGALQRALHSRFARDDS